MGIASTKFGSGSRKADPIFTSRRTGGTIYIDTNYPPCRISWTPPVEASLSAQVKTTEESTKSITPTSSASASSVDSTSIDSVDLQDTQGSAVSQAVAPKDKVIDQESNSTPSPTPDTPENSANKSTVMTVKATASTVAISESSTVHARTAISQIPTLNSRIKKQMQQSIGTKVLHQRLMHLVLLAGMVISLMMTIELVIL